MSTPHLLASRVCCSLIVSWIIISCFPECTQSAVTLESIKIFTTHDWFGSKPTIYFQCKGENKTILPDVKETDVLYTFKGEESWQPLTDLQSTKCKRCGFYEQDNIKTDDTFDEWEFCPSEFTAKGKYTHFKEKEISATFLCPECAPPSLSSASQTNSSSDKKGKGLHTVLLIVICIVVSLVVIMVIVTAFKYWQKRKRQKDQARFLELFEDGDDIEDELGLGNAL